MSKEIAIQELVFETENASVIQCDESGGFIVRLFDDEIELKLCGLMSFRRKVQQIDITTILLSSRCDIEIITLPQHDRIFVFSIREILELRELFSGVLTMLELNSLIHSQLVRKFV